MSQVPPLNNSIQTVNIARVRSAFMGLEPTLSRAQLQPPWNTVTSSEDGDSDVSQGTVFPLLTTGRWRLGPRANLSKCPLTWTQEGLGFEEGLSVC